MGEEADAWPRSAQIKPPPGVAFRLARQSLEHPLTCTFCSRADYNLLLGELAADEKTRLVSCLGAVAPLLVRLAQA